jgi:hypothetical protein
MAQGTKFGSERLARVSIGWREDQLSAINRIAHESGQSFGSVVRDLVDRSLRTRHNEEVVQRMAQTIAGLNGGQTGMRRT